MLRHIQTAIYVFLLSLFAFALAACGGRSSNAPPAPTSPSASPGSTSPPGGSQSGGTPSSGGSSSGGSGTMGGSTGGNGGTTGGSATGNQYVYIGDPTSLQIDAFKINSDGTLSPVPGSPFQVSGQGQPFQTAGNTLAVVGQFLFTDATGSPNGLFGFKIDPATGTLTAVNTASSTSGSWFLLAGNSQQNVLYASGLVNMTVNNGTAASNGIVAYAVRSDGSLKSVSTVTSQNSQAIAGAIAADRQSRFLYSWSNGQIYVFNLNGDGSVGSQVSGSPFKISNAYQPISPSDPNACFGASQKPILAVDPTSGRFLYASCDANAQVDEIAVSNSGQLSLIGTVPSPGPKTELSSLTISTDGMLLFGTEEEGNSVISFKIDRSTGQLAPGSTVAAGTRPNQSAIDLGNHFLYATNGSSNVSKNDFNPGSNNLSEYTVTAAGTMTPLPDSPRTVGTRPASVIVVHF